MTKQYKPKNKQWFQKRIGKTIYRDHTGCDCKDCEDVLEKGLTVRDEEHAEYLAMVDADFGAEGNESNYRDNLS